MSDAFIPERLARMHDLLAEQVERGSVPGVVTLVSRGGETHVHTAGRLALDGPAMHRDTIFRISSMTKTVLGVAALILLEECRIRIDDAVDELLPELAGRRVLRAVDAPLDDTVAADRPITVRDLLTFTSGYGLVMRAPGSTPIQRALDERDLNQGAPPQPDVPPAPDEWLRRLGELPLIHQPGAMWSYNTSADILGVLLARAAGQDLDTVLRQRIFDPLGMIDTGFSVPPEEIHRLATEYEVNPATGAFEVYDVGAGGQWSHPPAFASGAAGLVSTVDDMHAFARMLLDLGRHPEGRILSRASVDFMTTDRLSPAQRAATWWPGEWFDTHGWGVGVSMVTRRTDLVAPVGSYGWDGGLGTAWQNDPSEDLVGLCFTQRPYDSPVAPVVIQDFWTTVYSALD